MEKQRKNTKYFRIAPKKRLETSAKTLYNKIIMRNYAKNYNERNMIPEKGGSFM